MTNKPISPAYQSRARWNSARPHILVIACSDGRLQENLDDFLRGHLSISRYDRLYAPGGPGALAASGMEYLRSDNFKRECHFLVEAHDIEEVLLVFHGPAENGPDEAICADYRRIFPRLSAAQIRTEQEKDVVEILSGGFGWRRRVHVRVFRCEVNAEGAIHFVDLTFHVVPSQSVMPLTPPRG